MNVQRLEFRFWSKLLRQGFNVLTQRQIVHRSTPDITITYRSRDTTTKLQSFINGIASLPSTALPLPAYPARTPLMLHRVWEAKAFKSFRTSTTHTHLIHHINQLNTSGVEDTRSRAICALYSSSENVRDAD